MKVSRFKREAEQLLEQLKELTEQNLTSKGQTIEESQRLYILDAIRIVGHRINGTTEGDME